MACQQLLIFVPYFLPHIQVVVYIDLKHLLPGRVTEELDASRIDIEKPPLGGRDENSIAGRLEQGVIAFLRLPDSLLSHISLAHIDEEAEYHLPAIDLHERGADAYGNMGAIFSCSCTFDRTYSARCNMFLEYLPCLLYTSPSPRDRTRSRMPSSA